MNPPVVVGAEFVTPDFGKTKITSQLTEIALKPEYFPLSVDEIR